MHGSDTLATFTRKLNAWGIQAQPFLFVIDFELNKPFACVLDEAATENIFYDFQGKTNFGTRPSARPIQLTAAPITFEAYKRKFDVVSERLHYGDSFLTNLTIRTDIQVNLSLSQIIEGARAKYRLLFRHDFVVFSPETFVRIADNRIFAYPMKGTADASVPGAGEALLHDQKELAEHVTIVDLIRNDLSQVASRVNVDRFRYLEKVSTYGNDLWQMSSEISGDLNSNWRESLGDLLIKLLPAGSVSGAPKKTTLNIISQAEGSERGYYTGVFGYFDGTVLDSAVMIRYLENENGKMYYRSGGGITTQSDPLKEYKEALAKIYVPLD